MRILAAAGPFPSQGGGVLGAGEGDEVRAFARRRELSQGAGHHGLFLAVKLPPLGRFPVLVNEIVYPLLSLAFCRLVPRKRLRLFFLLLGVSFLGSSSEATCRLATRQTESTRFFSVKSASSVGHR